MIPHYCLFFSYKGGVGRTSALMNVALFLAKRKKRVLVIDLDLHAPGVDIFDVTDEELRKRLPSYHPTKCYLGLQQRRRFTDGKVDCDESERKKLEEKIEQEFRRIDPKDQFRNAPLGFLELALAWQEKPAEKRELPPLEYPDEINGKNDDWGRQRNVYRLPKRHLGEGDILVMRAGNHDDPSSYRQKLVTLDLGKLDPGAHVQIANTHQQPDVQEGVRQSETGSAPGFVSELKREIASKLEPDYVLVDARPGFDPISVFAMRWLADCVVLASNLNPWNIKGIIEAYDFLRECPSQKESQNILMLITPIPNYAKTSLLYADQFETIRVNMPRVRNNGTGSEGQPIEIPYSDILSLRDVLITDIQSNDPAVQRYEALGRLIVSGNSPDLENRIHAAKSAGDPDQVVTAFERLFREYTRNEALPFEYGVYLLSVGREEEAEKQLRDAWSIVIDRERDQVERRINSPYRQDTAYHYSRAQIAGVRRFLEHARARAIPIELQSEVESRLSTLKGATERISEAIHESELYTTESGHHPLHAMLGEVYFLESECLSLRASILQEMVGRGATQSRDQEFGDVGQITVARIACLQRSIKQYETAVDLARKVPRYQHELGMARARLATLVAKAGEVRPEAEAGTGTVIQRYFDAITAFEEELKLRSDSADGLLQIGRFRLATAITTQGSDGARVALPLFLSEFPYVEETEEPRSWLNGTRPTIDEEELRNAKKELANAVKHRSHEFFAYFNRGLISAILSMENHRSPHSFHPDVLTEVVRNGLSEAIVDFHTTSLYQPHYSPAYLISGMIQFLLREMEEKDAQLQEKSAEGTLADIRSRQAFYRLEHFIDRELERLVSRYNDNRPLADVVKNRARDPFYFDPEDITQILERPFDFMFTLEEVLGWPPILALLRPSDHYRKDDAFIEMIARHT